MAENFAPSWLEMLQEPGSRAVDSATMGWRHEGARRTGFAFGGRLYREDGTDIPLPVQTGDALLSSWYVPTGSREAWLEAAGLLTGRRCPELDILVAASFAAPLMTFAGALYGAILSVWGPPGTAKSTAQQVGAAVFGHPKQTRESLTSSARSVQRRLGLCRNLAAWWDDIQEEKHQQALFQTMFLTTQGAEGGKLSRFGEYRERLEWQTLLVACSNTSFVDYLIGRQTRTTAGLRRVFEIELSRRDDGGGMISPARASRVFGALEHNYGAMGVAYARLLAAGHREISEQVLRVTGTFCEKVQGGSDENYWWGTCGALLVGGMLARRLGARIDVEAMETCLTQVFEYNRVIRRTEGNEGGIRSFIERTLVDFLNHHAGHVLYLNRIWKGAGRSFGVRDVEVLKAPKSIRNPVAVQIARDQRLVCLSKRELYTYLEKDDVKTVRVVDGLKLYFKAEERRMTLGSGTMFAGIQEQVLQIQVPVESRNHALWELAGALGMPQD